MTRRQPASNAAKPPPQPASCATSPTRPGRRANWRENTRPAQPLQPHVREKVLPVSVKTLILGCFERAGRTLSRTRRDNVATLKPTTPLLAPNKGPLKPTTPLRLKTAPKTPISHPQRRWRFQTHTDTSEQRRWRFQSHAGTSEQRQQGFQTTGPPDLQRLAAAHASRDDTTAPKFRMQFDWMKIQQGQKTLRFQRCEFNV